MAAWSVQKQVKVAGLLTLSVALFYLAFTIDRVDGKVFEHTNVVQLDAASFDEKVGDSVHPTTAPVWNACDRDRSFTQLWMSDSLTVSPCSLLYRMRFLSARVDCTEEHLDASSQLPPIL